MKKRLLSVVIAFAMCFSLVASLSPWKDTVTASDVPNILEYSQNSSSAEFVVNSYSGMVAFSELSATTDFTGKTIYLSCDIDMSQGHTPISSFAGTFDGQGHALYNINISASRTSAGLFAVTTSTAVIKDTGIVGGTMTLAADDDAQRLGSFVGVMNGGIIERCYSTATLTGTRYASTSTGDISVGGIVGANLGGGVIKDCYFAGSATGVNHASGISDWAQGHYEGYVGTLINCLNMGKLYATDTYALARYSASILESNKASAVTNCYYIGDGQELSFTTQDIKIDEYKLGNGELAYMLNGGGNAWHQGELCPELGGGKGGVYKLTLTFVANGQTSTQTLYMNAGDKYTVKSVSATLASSGNVTDNAFTMPAANATLTVTTSTPNINNYTAGGTVFVITNAAGFTKMASLVNGGTTLSGVSLYMLCDIDMTSVANHTPIGVHISDSDRSTSFQGKLYGNGYKVINLKVDKSSLNGAGLFGSAYKAHFHDLGIYGGYVKSDNRAGGIAGYGDACTFKNCYNTASITTLTGTDGAGGLTGVSRSSTKFTNCFNYGTVTATANYAGGLSGWGQTNVVIKNCFNAGTINASSQEALSRYNGSLTNIPENSFYLPTVSPNSGYGESITLSKLIDGTTAWLLNTNGGADTNSGVFTITPVGPALRGENSGAAVKLTVKATDNEERLLDAKVLYCNGGNTIGINGNAANAFVAESITAPTTDGTVEVTAISVGMQTLAIGNAAELAAFATAVNGGTGYKGYYVYLTADIDMTSLTAVSIGTEAAPFMGVFDGRGSTISGYNVTASPKYQGLFGFIKGGLVQNVFLTDSTITGGYYSGALVGKNDFGTVINCGTDSEAAGFYTEAGRQVSVMSFNIRVPNDSSPNALADRKPRIQQHLTTYSPDIVGFQEVTPAWKTVIDSQLSGYSKEFVWRDSSNAEAAPLYWKTSVFTVLEQGSFWLSDTPDTMSKDWDAGCYRTCSYAALVHKTSGNLILAFNSHFDHQSETARTNSAVLVVKRMKALQDKYTALGYGDNIATFCTGDYNCKPDTAAYATMAAAFGDMRYVADSLQSSEGQITFQGFSNSGGSIIDYIFTDTRGANTVSFKVCAEKVDGGFISDHYTLYGIMGLEAQNVGGIVGYNSGLISDCFTLGTVKKSLNAGGIAGYNTGSIQNSYCGAALSATDYMGGIAGTQKGVVASSYYLSSADYNAFAAESNTVGSMTETEFKSADTAALLGADWAYMAELNVGYPYPTALFKMINLIIKSSSAYSRTDNIILGVKKETNIAALTAQFENKTLKILDLSGKELDDAHYAGTGTVISVVIDGKVTDSATLVVKGDINGDGALTASDYIAVSAHVSGAAVLTNAYELAADTNYDDSVSASDYNLLMTQILGRA